MTSKKYILIAPLNWGLGHATRCIPIINEFLKQGYNPIIASDGDALQLLRLEFPNLKSIEFPSYEIQYPKNGKFLKWKLMLQLPHFLATKKAERKMVEELIVSKNLIGIISDNRFGVRSNKIPSVYITHQLNVLSGNTTFISSKLHQHLINKFDECWIPDIDSIQNFSGKLSQSSKIKNKKFIDVLSRLEIIELPIKYDLLVLLSGVEPLRSQLEEKLISELKNFKGSVLFVKGVISEKQETAIKGTITFCNYLLTVDLEKAINQSKIILARSGYSTIMDLAALEKKAFFIPTAGQFEQEYLAKYLQEMKIAPFAPENKFKLEMLKEVDNYSGFSKRTSVINTKLFHLFQGK